ncbi:MAG: energy transducer TonB [Pyrinomonadaceae bacterium]
MPGITALEEYADATVVFTGEVVDVQKSEQGNDGGRYETVKIAVDRAWKNNLESTITVTGADGWKVGARYLIYGYLNDDKLTYATRGCCSRTGPLEQTEKDIDEFFNAGYALAHVSVPRKEKVISAGWLNRRALNFKDPKYPSELKKPRPAARVEVRIVADTEGNVISAEVSRGPVAFHDAALEAARKLKFSPTQLSGVPVKVSGWVSYDFKP